MSLIWIWEKVWEHEDNLFAEFLKPVPIVTPHFIEIRLGYPVLFLHFFHMLMECNHLRLQVSILFHQIVDLVGHPAQLGLQINHLLAKSPRRILEFLQVMYFGL